MRKGKPKYQKKYRKKETDGKKDKLKETKTRKKLEGKNRNGERIKRE